MSKPKTNVVDELRRAIAAAKRDGISRYRISKETGLSEGMLSRFMDGQNTPSLDTAALIAKCLKLRLVLVKDT